MGAPSYDEELLARREMVDRIRTRARDFAPLNRLISGEEHSDRMIMMALHDIIDDFNASPPPVGAFFVANFPNRLILITGALAILIESAALLYARNDLAYASTGTTVQFGQSREYMHIAATMWQQYEVKKKELKTSINAQQAVAASGGFFTSFARTYRPMWGVDTLRDYGSLE